MQNNLPTQTLSGGVKEYEKKLTGEYKLAERQLISEHEERVTHLKKTMRTRVNEYELMSMFTAANTLNAEKTEPVDMQSVMWVENSVAKIDIGAAFYSLTIRQWQNELGATFTAVLCDIINYFARQFQVKNNISDAQILQIVAKLLAKQPQLKLKELIYVLSCALEGKYGQTYQNVGIDSILNWISLYYEESAIYLEGLKMSNKPDESRGETPWKEADKLLKDYEEKQRAKKRITDKVWGEEKKAQEDTARKEQVEAYKNSLTENEKE